MNIDTKLEVVVLPVSDVDRTKRFYERLLSAGKHKKLALTACIRKIVTALNAMLRDDCTWQPSTT